MSFYHICLYKLSLLDCRTIVGTLHLTVKDESMERLTVKSLSKLLNDFSLVFLICE